MDGRDGVLFAMKDAEVERVDPIRCFVVREVLDRLRGDVDGDLLAVFEARREFLERAAEREYDQAAKPTEIVLTEENYPRLRAGPC